MTLRELTDYYAALLAYEYRGLPNATRQMQLYAKQAVADLLAQSVRDAFNIDTAVGAQLDVLGKYLGQSRQISPGLTLPYFGLWDYGSTHDPADYQGTWVPSTDTPTLPTASGVTGDWYVIQVAGASTSPITATFDPGDIIYSNGTTWVRSAYTVDNANGLTDYTNFATNASAIFLSYLDLDLSTIDLTDEQYRLVLKLQAINSTGDTTLAGIMAALEASFGNQFQLTDNKDMTLTYDVTYLSPLPTTLLAQFLPRPMAVGITVNGFTPTPPPVIAAHITTQTGNWLVTEAGDSLITE